MPAGLKNIIHPAVFKDLGLIDYGKALDLQIETVHSMIDNSLQPDHIFLLEHPPVFTLGKNGGRENLVVSDQFLTEKNIEVVQTGRGGNITYHGPGQLVMYPIVNLERIKIGVQSFVSVLEEIMIKTCLDLGVKTERNKLNHGVWVENGKIGSVGLGIKKGISFHGISLNVEPDLSPFLWINPCGLNQVSMTSIRIEREKNSITSVPGIDMVNFAKTQFKKHFLSILTEYENQT